MGNQVFTAIDPMQETTALNRDVAYIIDLERCSKILAKVQRIADSKVKVED